MSVLYSEVIPKMAEKKQTGSTKKRSTAGAAAKRKTGSTAAKKKTSTGSRKSSASSKAAAQKQTAYYIKRKRRIKGIVLLCLSILFTLVFFMPGENVWKGLHDLYRGLFGFLGFMVPVITLYCSVQMFRERSTYRFPLKVFFFSGTVVMLAAVIYAFGSSGMELSDYGTELGNAFREGAEHTGTGITGALLGIPLSKLLGAAAGGLVAMLILAFFVYMSFEALFINMLDKLKEPVSEKISEHKEIRSRVREEENRIKTETRKKAQEEHINRVVDKRIEQAKRKAAQSEFRRIDKTPIYEPDIPSGKSGADSYADSYFSQGEVIQNTAQSSPAPEAKKRKKDKTAVPETINETPDMDDIYSDSTLDIGELLKQQGSSENPMNSRYADAINTVFTPAAQKSAETAVHHASALPKTAPAVPSKEPKVFEPKPSELHDFGRISSPAEVSYLKPPFTLLEAQPAEAEKNISLELNQSASKLVETLKSFGVSTTVINICRGPSVTRYELQPASGVKISKITNLADDIAMNLAATGVRIEAPIPGKNAVGIEVPNKNVTVVKMRSLVESGEFQKAKSRLTVALGKDIAGKIMLADLAKMPHLLIAGSTGSGKSVCINSMLVSLLYKSSPDEVKLILIDPKVVELGVYNGIPHLLVPVVTDPRKAAGALNWAVNEMLERYKTFAEYNVRDMHGYNRLVDKQNAEISDNYTDDSERTFEEDEMLAQAQAELKNNEDKPKEKRKLEKMCNIVIVIDELADLMMAAPNEVEESICRLAQMARAAGMHLVIATQRPSVDVITGLIKANVPSRIAFAVKSQIDSRTILDTSGAEKLLGRGDMLYSPIGTTKPLRVQGCFVDDDEIEGIIEFIKKNKSVEYDKDVIDEIERSAVAENSTKQNDNADGDADPMMEQAIQCVVEAGQASTSLLQRRLRLGYARAGRLIDEMEQMGIVGPHEGAKPRKVLMTYQQWLERNMSNTDT